MKLLRFSPDATAAVLAAVRLAHPGFGDGRTWVGEGVAHPARVET